MLGDEFITAFFGNGELYSAFLPAGETTDLSPVDILNAPIPLPAAFPLFGTGLAVLGFIGWRRKRKAAAAV